MDHISENKKGKIYIDDDLIVCIANRLVSRLISYKVKNIELVNNDAIASYTFIITLEGPIKSDFVTKIDDFQEKFVKTIQQSLNIDNVFSSVIIG